jgi:hypothetical protein
MGGGVVSYVRLEVEKRRREVTIRFGLTDDLYCTVSNFYVGIHIYS